MGSLFADVITEAERREFWSRVLDRTPLEILVDGGFIPVLVVMVVLALVTFGLIRMFWGHDHARRRRGGRVRRRVSAGGGVGPDDGNDDGAEPDRGS